MNEAAGPVTIDYVNHKGERAWRRILPVRLYYGVTQHHPEPGWLLVAYDLDRDAARTFAMRDIHAWREDVAVQQR